MPRLLDTRTLLLFLILVVVAGMRLVPHTENFAAVGALSLFGGATLMPRWLGFVLPLALVMVTDWVLSFLKPYPMFYPGFGWVYAAYGVYALIGWQVGRSRHWVAPIVAALVGSLAFFFLSNVGVWLHSGMYPMTAAGLWTCFELAVPFFRATVVSDLIFSAVFFWGFALLQVRFPRLRHQLAW